MLSALVLMLLRFKLSFRHQTRFLLRLFLSVSPLRTWANGAVVVVVAAAVVVVVGGGVGGGVVVVVVVVVVVAVVKS